MVMHLSGWTSLVFQLLITMVGSTRLAAAQASRLHVPVATGTYAAGTTRLPSAGGDGCWLEVAPFAVDSLRVQILCRYPAPGHHLGVVDARLPLRGDSVVYERSFAGGACRIFIRFAGARAHVAQEGSDRACGFGASVDVSGTYRRLAKRRPSFDLAPIERSSAPRPPLE